MKKIKVLLIVAFFLSAGSSLQHVTAQEKSKAEQEKEIKIQLEIDQQKKAMAEQKKAMKEQKKSKEESSQDFKDQQDELDKNLDDIQVEVEATDQAADALRFFNRRGGRSFRFDEPFVFSSPGVETFYNHEGGGDSESTTWNFSKTVKDNTFSRDYSFDVEKTANSVVMSINGDCKAGEIRIKIIMPNGKNYSDIVIDEFGNLNWRKSFTISETENMDKAGEWKFKIESIKATGYFKISLQTY